MGGTGDIAPETDFLCYLHDNVDVDASQLVSFIFYIIYIFKFLFFHWNSLE